ncbi:MAG: Hpt domain-containing protein [Magnetococcales bacterium]|nr:Hpt domain-containing protein [Magnetococcales bacterium]
MRQLTDDLGMEPEPFIERFFQDVIKQQSLIHANSVAGGHIETLIHASHRLKSSSRTIGAERLGRLAADLEQLVQQEGNSGCTSEHLVALDREVMLLREALHVRSG